MTSGTSIPTTRFIWDSNWTLPDGPSMTMSSPSVATKADDSSFRTAARRSRWLDY